MACKYIYKGTTYTKEQFESFVKEEFVKRSPENKFLSLLEKDSNWVTFFIKSIIFDSAKKGYEKVLFPSGNTASKVEGHSTLEEFKKQKKDRIKELEKKKYKIISGEYEKEINKQLSNFKHEYDRTIKLKEDGKLYDNFIFTHFPNKISEQEQLLKDIPSNLINIDNEINQLKQELERVETEGFGALKPIYNFYENTVANILKKQGYNPVLITDEYGNTWNEVNINQVRDLAEVLLQRNEANQIIGQANIKAMTVLIDAINQKQDTLPHEYAHHYIAWFRNTPIVQEGIKKWGSEEALVQSIGEQVIKQKGEAYNWWNNFVKWVMNQFNSLSKLQKEELTQILTDAFLTRQDLGSKQDIEGFKEYLFNKSKEKPIDNLPLNNIQPEEIKDITEADNSPVSITPIKEVIQLPKTAQLILPIGISGSGKSTWINSLDKDKYTIISPDEIRKELTGDVSDQSKNAEVFKLTDDRILEALKKGNKVILDATNLNTTFRRLMITNLKSLYPKLDIRYKLLDVDPEVAKQRIANDIANKVDRSKTPDEIIDLQYQQYLQSKLDIKDEPIYEFNNERTAITDLLDRYSKNDNSLRKLANIAAISGKTQNISNVPVVKNTDNINENIITMAKYGRTVRELLAVYPSLTEHFKGINLDTKLSDYIKQQEIEKQVTDYVEAIKQDMADNFNDYEDYLSNIDIYTIDDLYNYPNEKLLNDLCINGNLSK